MARKVSWEAIKTEYITTDISQRKLAEKHGVPYPAIRKRAEREGWYPAKKEHSRRVVAKATQKAEAKQVRIATKELTLLDKIEKHLDRAISDMDQFNRYIITEQVGHGMTETSEQMYSKTDMRALKDAMQVLTMVEKMKQERLDKAAASNNDMGVRFSDNSEEWSE